MSATTLGPRHRHSPRVRRLAAQAGVALERVTGTGPHGRITPADVADAATTEVAPRSPDPRPRDQAAQARATCLIEVDVTPVMALGERVAARLDQPVPTDAIRAAFVVRAVVEGLRSSPQMSATIGPDGQLASDVDSPHLGIVVDTETGTSAVVVRSAGDLSLSGILRRLSVPPSAQGRTGRRTGDLTGATFVVTSTGREGVLVDIPVPAAEHVAGLAVGAVVERPVVVRRPDGEGGIAIRSMCYLALTYDIGVIDRPDATTFLALVKKRLEAPQLDAEIG